MINILDRYIGKIVLITIITTLFILTSLSGIVKFMDQLKKTGQGNYNTVKAGIYIILNIPKDIQFFFPMAILLGVILGLGILSQQKELVAMQIFGFTRVQTVFAMLKTTAVPLILFLIVISEWIAPNLEKMARDYRARAIHGSSLLSTQNGMWMKDGNDFIHIKYIKNSFELSDITIYMFNNQRFLKSIRYAVTAKFDTKKKLWKLLQVHEFNLKDLKQITKSKIISSIWKTNLTPDKLDAVILDPAALSIRKLYSYIKYLNESGLNSKLYQINMWMKIFQPLVVLEMMLIAFLFVFSALCKSAMGIQTLIGIIFGFFFYVFNQIFCSITLVFNISPIIGALLPNISFPLIILWFLRKCS